MARPANTEVDDERMRTRLAAGALALFRQYGLEAVTLRRLATQMGVSHTMLYRYFESKEALFTAVRLASLQALHQQLDAADNAAQGSLQRIRAVAEALIRFGIEHAREYRFLFSAEQPALAENAELLALRHGVFDHIVAIAEAAAAQGLIRMEPRTWVHMAWALLHGLLTLNESNQLLEGRSFSELVDAALEVLLGAAKRPTLHREALS